MKNVLVAGATGYLGRFIVESLVAGKNSTTVLVRNASKFESFGIPAKKLITAEVTDRASLKDCCDGVEVVISSVGITRQTDGLSYMDVDYQANMNLLNEAVKSGVRKFIYVSVLNGEILQSVKICEAKEKFVGELRKSGIAHCVVRPNGFFSDMTEYYSMAKKGRIYLFGDGKLKSNPIHGKDVAQVCMDAVDREQEVIEVGGPDTFSQTEIATLAFEAVGRPVKITYIPDWIRRLVLRMLKMVMSSHKYGPIEFFMNVMAIDMMAPEYGRHNLKEYFASLNDAAVKDQS